MRIRKRRNGDGKADEDEDENRRNKDKLSVFDFSDDDMRVEADSRKYLSKYPTLPETPTKRTKMPSLDHHLHPLDKYDFLRSFAKGAETSRKDPGSGTPNKIARLEASFRARYSTLPLTNSLHGNRRPGGCRTEQTQNKILCIDSDDDGRMPMRTSSCSDLSEKKGSFEEVSQHGSSRNDCEAVVVVTPKYVKYGKMYYTNCLLSFTCECIRLEGSPLCDRNSKDSLEWSTFDVVKIEHQPCESVKADVVKLHLKFVDACEAEAFNTNAGSKELEFAVIHDPQWFTKQEQIRSLDLKYENVWETVLSECSFNEPFDDVVYPEGDPDAVFISRKDVEVLQPRTFLNDTIIDFYVKYLLDKMKPEEQQRFHFFNTFFFQKLADMDRIFSPIWEGREAFQRVRKWTRNINLFEKDYIFIPVNYSLHWSLIIICFPGKVAKLGDEDMDGSSRRPCILHMDSIRGSHRGLENVIRSYLWEEWKARHGVQEGDISSKFLNLHFNALQLPQQENLSDCGLFLLHYAELFLAQAVNFSTKKYSNCLNKDWFLPAEVSLKKREHIRKLIHKIVEDSVLRNPPSTKCFSSELDEGDSGVKIIQENHGKEMCDGGKFHSGVNEDVEEQQLFLENAVTDDTFQQREQPPNELFGNIQSPMEIDEIEMQATCLPGDASCSHEVSGDDKPMPPLCPFNRRNRTQVAELGIPFVNSKTFAGTSEMTSDVHNLEDFVHEVASSSETEKDDCECSSMLSEDLIECIVEDSEEESGTQIIKSKTPCLTPRKVIDIVE